MNFSWIATQDVTFDRSNRRTWDIKQIKFEIQWRCHDSTEEISIFLLGRYQTFTLPVQLKERDRGKCYFASIFRVCGSNESLALNQVNWVQIKRVNLTDHEWCVHQYQRMRKLGMS